MRKWRITAAVLLGLLLVGLAACNPLGDEQTTEQPFEVVRGDLIISVSGSGNVEAAEKARLSFGSGGRLERIYIEEGDEVNQGDILAVLETDDLELAITQAEVAQAQAEVALTQSRLAEQTAEHELENTQDRQDTLELALLQAQIDVRNAEHHLDETRDIYTWPEIQIAKDEAEDAEAYVDYVNERLSEALTTAEELRWLATLAYAQARLATAESTLDAQVRSFDTEEVAIAGLQVEAAQKAEAQAQTNLDELDDDIALAKLRLEAARESVVQAEQSVALARDSLNQARNDFDEGTIIALIDGVVTSVTAEEGDIIPSPSLASAPVIHLIDPSSMELVVEVDEIDVPGVVLGQKAIITLDALPSDEFIGTVTTIFPLPSEVGGVVVYNVKIELDVPEGSGIKVGMSASADIVLTESRDILLVPNRAIDEDSTGQPMVRVIIDEEIEERAVVIGMSDGFDTEILSGLSEGEMVITEVRVR
jgi:HlyD family secretion protein